MLQSPCRGCQYQGRTDCRPYCLTLEWARERELKRLHVSCAIDPDGLDYRIEL